MDDEAALEPGGVEGVTGAGAGICEEGSATLPTAPASL